MLSSPPLEHVMSVEAVSAPAPEEISPRGILSATMANLLAVLVVAIVLFLPLVLIWWLYVTPEPLSGSLKTTVGIAVVVRATARRLSQGLLRSTLGAFTRTAFRTITRRITRIAVRQLAVLTMASTMRRVGAELRDESLDAESARQHPVLAIGGGFLALFASFYLILLIIGPERAGAVVRDTPLWLAALLVAAPILVHAAATIAAARLWGVPVEFRTQLDGLLLQGYFTGAGSFLPLTTDVEYRGSKSANAQVATTTLLVLLAVHYALASAGQATGLYPVQLAAAAVLVYCFVFSFPLTPLEGHHLWKRSKLLWLVVWLPILVVFTQDIPESFATVL
jgi:hypothetical protein